MTQAEQNNLDPRLFNHKKPMTRDEVSTEFFKNRARLKKFQSYMADDNKLYEGYQNQCIYTDLPDGRHWFQGINPHPTHAGLIMNYYSPWINDALPMTITAAQMILPLLNDKAALIGSKDDALKHWYANPYDPNRTLSIPKLDLRGDNAEKALRDGTAEYIEDKEPESE